MQDEINWNDLRYFLAVAQTGRLQTAASRLNVTHTTVARRLARLEEALAVKLFNQDQFGFQLTAIGERLLPVAQEMETGANITRELAQNTDKSLSGNLRIGAPDGIGNTFLAEQISVFLNLYQDVSIELVPLPVSQNLSKREVDIAISMEPSRLKNVHNAKLTDYDLLIYTSAELLSRTGLDPSDEKTICAQNFSGYITDLLFTDELSFNEHIDPGIRARFNSSTVLAQLEFIASGGGIGVLPHFLAKKRDNLVPVLTETHKLTRTYWLLIPLELKRMASIRTFERFLLNAFKNNAANFRYPTSEPRS